MSTAVVILNWNGEQMLRRFLPSVVRYTDSPGARVVVADNASTDNSLQVLREEFPEVEVIRLAENYGFAEGYNKALAQVEADYYVLLNSDVEVTPHWLDPLITFLDTHADVAAVQPKLLKSGAESQFEYAGAAGGFLDKHGYPYCRGRIFGTVEADNGQYDTPMEVDWTTGACLVIRATDYHAAGGMDGRFFAHNEEIDLCWRLRIMGKRLFCLPESRVYHLGGGTLPQGNPRKTYLNFRNNLTMIYKNAPQERLSSILRARRWLDWLAALQSLLTGHVADAKAIMKARKEFYNKINLFEKDREMIQNNRQLPTSKDMRPLSILWQYYVRGRRQWNCLPVITLLLMLFTSVSASAETAGDDKTRGIGVYPGRVTEAFAPTISSAGDGVRNLALNRQAYHSSCYDYNLTAQLVTDGFFTTDVPPCLEVLVNGENLPKNLREYTIDGNDWNRNTLMGSSVSLRMNWTGMTVDIDSVVVYYTVAYHADQATGGYALRISDGKTTLAEDKGDGLPGDDMGYELHSDPNKQTEKGSLPARISKKGYAWSASSPLSTFMLEMNMQGAEYWQISDMKFFKEDKPVDTDLLPMSRFESAWMSDSRGDGDEWVYVDLGAPADIEEVRLYWIGSSPKGSIEVSDDAQSWTKIASLPEKESVLADLQSASREYKDLQSVNKVITYSVPAKAEARYVRVSLDGQRKPYVLSEMEVYGRGGTLCTPCEAPLPEGNTLSLDGGDWRLQRASAVTAQGEQIATAAFEPTGWLTATVPATVLTSYVNAGAVPNQNFNDNVDYASESFFCSDFFYRREFLLPSSFAGKAVFLNLDGINWKARLWLNGQPIGSVEGAFIRGRIDVSKYLVEGVNTLAIEILHPDHPGATKEKNYQYPGPNGGLLGYDNPTFHASVGWDWIPTVRGRETGIWNDVYLTAEEAVTLADPLVSTSLNLPDTLATLTPEVRYYNNVGQTIAATLCFDIAGIHASKAVTVEPGEGSITLSPDEFPELRDARLRLWWPNGYGEPYLYDAEFSLISEANGDTLSTVRWAQGIRQMSYKDKDTALTIYVNGRRVVPLGGNWGFSEQNLCYRQREYDIAIGCHRDMNFNMIRNWVGQIGDDEFYDACDRNGIMVWQDFWLANPADGPDPADEPLFVSNAADMVKRIRHHASIALYCGRNEGYPPATLDSSLCQLTAGLHPGMEYISSSADDGVSGHGPYNALPAKEYFERQSGKLHSERGMPNIMTMESLQRTMTTENQWPQGDVWGQHDYTMTGAQKGASFNELIAGRFGAPQTAEEFTAWAQLINYEGYRAMYESGSRDRMGLLIWMSHPCWPSMTWQCYDYFFEPTGAYFGCKKACEPLHIQRNASTGKVEIVNLGVGRRDALRAVAAVYDKNGKLLEKMVEDTSSADDSCIELMKVDGDFVRLALYDGGTLLSENTYVLAENLEGLQITTVTSRLSADQSMKCPTWRQRTVELENTGGVTAYLIRLNLLDGEGNQILPVNYSDNYFHLLPGEKRSITISWQAEDQQADGASVTVSGLNVE